MPRLRPNLIPPLEIGERVIYWLVAVSLMIGAVVYLGYTLVDVTGLYLEAQYTNGTLALLNGSLLTLMLAQVVYTTLTFLETGVLQIEPVLIVGIIASVRRILVITATLSTNSAALEPSTFQENMVELGTLGGITLVLAVAIYLIRRHRPKEQPCTEIVSQPGSTTS